MPSAGSSISLQASNDFHGNSALRSTSAACGAIFSSQKERSVSRNSRWTSVRAKDGLLMPHIFAEARGDTPAPARRPAGPGLGGGQVAQEQLREPLRCRLGDPVRDAL